MELRYKRHIEYSKVTRKRNLEEVHGTCLPQAGKSLGLFIGFGVISKRFQQEIVKRKDRPNREACTIRDFISRISAIDQLSSESSYKRQKEYPV